MKCLALAIIIIYLFFFQKSNEELSIGPLILHMMFITMPRFLSFLSDYGRSQSTLGTTNSPSEQRIVFDIVSLCYEVIYLTVLYCKVYVCRDIAQAAMIAITTSWWKTNPTNKKEKKKKRNWE